MSSHEDGAARSFVYAAGFHADDAVFDYVDNAYTVCAAQFIELGYNLAHFHLFAVKRNGDAFFEFDRNFRFLVGSLFRRHAEHEQMIVIGRVGGILEFQPFVTDVPYIAVAAVRSVGGEGKIDAVSAAVIDFFLARGHRPFIVSPGRDYLQIGSERFDAEFETDLIVAFARSAVADCRSAFLARYLHEFFWR